MTRQPSLVIEGGRLQSLRAGIPHHSRDWATHRTLSVRAAEAIRLYWNSVHTLPKRESQNLALAQEARYASKWYNFGVHL